MAVSLRHLVKDAKTAAAVAAAAGGGSWPVMHAHSQSGLPP